MDCQSRRRKSSFSDEDELRRMSRVWIQDADKDALLFQGMNLQHQPLQQQVPPVVVADHHMIRLQQQRANEMATTQSGPLSLQQRAMAAIALQEIRSSIDPKHNLLHQQHVQQNQSPLLATHQQQQGLKYPHHHVHHQQQLKALQQHLQQLPGNALLESRYQHQAAPDPDPTKIPGSPQLIIPTVMFPSSLSGISSAATLPSSSRGLHGTKPNPICPNIVTDLQQQQPKCSPSSSSRHWFSPSSLDLPQPSLRSSAGHVLTAATGMFPGHGLSGEFSERSGAVILEQQQEQGQCEKPSTAAAAAAAAALQGLPGFGSPNALPLPKSTTCTNPIPPCYNQASNSNSSKRLISSCNLDQAFTDLKNVAAPAAAGECSTSDNVVENQQKPSNSSAALQHEQQQQQQRQPMRTYTKVYKLGSIGRAIDVARFKNYVELCAELSRMFGLEGQLDQKNGWQLVFVDKENDLLLVGDDPWEEFVNSVRGIRILSPSEVSYYTSDERVDVV